LKRRLEENRIRKMEGMRRRCGKKESSASSAKRSFDGRRKD
jgi:hypothetical protein